MVRGGERREIMKEEGGREGKDVRGEGERREEWRRGGEGMERMEDGRGREGKNGGWEGKRREEWRMGGEEKGRRGDGWRSEGTKGGWPENRWDGGRMVLLLTSVPVLLQPILDPSVGWYASYLNHYTTH